MQVALTDGPGGTAARPQAKAVGLSLNQFVLREYGRIARRGTNAQLLRDLEQSPGRRPTRELIVAGTREDRQQE